MEIPMKNVVSRTDSTELLESIIEKRALRKQHRAILADDDFHFSSESLRFKNLYKNRYLNSCFDYNRVDLRTEDGESEYINASYVDGYKSKGRFIIAQTPLEETVNFFLRMCFLHQTRVIVTLADPSEKDEYQYWSPLIRSEKVYGQFVVVTRDIRSSGNVTVINLQVIDDDEDKLDIEQFIYTNWPRNGVPDEKTEFLNFVLAVRVAQVAADSQPSTEQLVVLPKLLVLSSGGQDRAGAFCLVDMSISRFDELKTISLTSDLHSLRNQRNNCLCLPEQYIFCSQVMSYYIKIAADKM